MKLGLIAALLLIASPVFAQSVQDVQLWPETDFSWDLNPSTRLIFVTAATRNRDEPYSEVELGAYLDIYIPRIHPLLFHRISSVDKSRIERFAIRLGYRASRSFDTTPAKSENRLQSDATFRSALPLGFLASDRNRFEFRFVNGVYSWRYRNEGKTERDFRVLGKTIIGYLSAELFYDSQYNEISRWRYSGGIVIPLGKLVTVEPYYTRQASRVPSQPQLNALGLTVNIFLRR
jgi:hypothetical protein